MIDHIDEIQTLNFVNCDKFDVGDSISLVGSSAILNHRDDAKEIDSHDDVMRFNHAKVRGFEDVCGQKSTIFLVNNHALQLISDPLFYDDDFKLEYPESKKDYVYDFDNLNIILRLDHDKISDNVEVIEKISENNRVAIVTKQCMKLGSALVGRQPSCGLTGLMVALQYFKEISCFGFNFNNDPTIDKHYYEAGNQTGGCHDFSKEQEIFRALNDNGRITLHY